jgi:hypothetical protein
MIFVNHLDSVRDPAALAGWLATTTRRECFRARQAADKFAPDGQAVDDLPEEDAVTAEDEVLLAERHAALREAFARLPVSNQRLLALLTADPPVPYAEISAWLGMAIGSIGPNRRRSLDRLRNDPAIAALIDAGAADQARSALRGCRLARPAGVGTDVGDAEPAAAGGGQGDPDVADRGTGQRNGGELAGTGG